VYQISKSYMIARIEELSKHLPGQHDQLSHGGGRGGGSRSGGSKRGGASMRFAGGVTVRSKAVGSAMKGLRDASLYPTSGTGHIYEDRWAKDTDAAVKNLLKRRNFDAVHFSDRSPHLSYDRDGTVSQTYVGRRGKNELGEIDVTIRGNKVKFGEFRPRRGR